MKKNRPNKSQDPETCERAAVLSEQGGIPGHRKEVNFRKVMQMLPQ